MTDYADPKNIEVQTQIIDLYLFGLLPLEIKEELNLRNFQPIYNLLKKHGLYERRPTRYPRKHFFNERFFQKIDTEEKAYFLGLIAADGSVAECEQRVKISLQARDRDILDKLVKAVDADFEVQLVDHQGYPQCQVSLNSKAMKEDLIALGLTPNKSLTMPGTVMQHIPAELVRHFLRGFFDGDGNVFLGGVYSSGTKYSVTVIGTMAFLEASFGVHYPSNSPIKKYKSCEMWYWRVSSQSQVFGFLKYVYENASVYLDRKYNYVKDYVLSECAHVKSGELLEIFASKEKDNQQPSSFDIVKLEGSETIEKQQTLNLVEYA